MKVWEPQEFLHLLKFNIPELPLLYLLGELMVTKAMELGERAKESSNSDCKDLITRECRELKADFDSLLSFGKELRQKVCKYSELWCEFDRSCNQFDELLSGSERKVKSEPRLDKATTSDLDRINVREQDIQKV